jgi:hypothetical protein
MGYASVKTRVWSLRFNHTTAVRKIELLRTKKRPSGKGYGRFAQMSCNKSVLRIACVC